MTKTKSTKRALLTSAVALLLCVSMLIGSTFAWFTDSVTSAGNIIKSGTLDVTMEWADGKEAPDSAVWEDASKGAIFNNDKWEPGYTEVRHIKIANKGTLALKYQVKIVANGKVDDLAEVIDVYFVDPAVQVADRTALNGVTPVGTLAGVLANMPGNASGDLNAGDSNIVTLAFKMRESAGNEYQDKAIGTDFSVQLVATQATVESDSFDNQYDIDAEYPLVVSGKKALNEALTLPYDETNVQIVVPPEAYAGNYAKVVTYENLTEENGKYTYAVDFAAEFNGEKADPAFDYKVNLQLPQFVDIEKITHNGKEIPLNECTYDAFTGEVTFYTNSFSPFEVIYTEVAENPTIEGRTITGGIFTVNPVTFDGTLDDENSEYIAINYEKDEETLFIVANREDTLIVAADGAEYYTAINGNYDIQKNVSGQLYRAFIKDNRSFKLSANTVYLLPGTYTEATTLSISTDMDVVGLGDKESVKVIKGTSSGSNRHLFNCSGTGADYIQVTICNMSIEINCDNIKNNKAEDNAAVQSIRKSKVKCYNLVINKAPATTTWENAAFYINSNNAVDGVKYPAYLYVENSVVNATNANYKSKVYATNGSKNYFYHYGLKYNNGESDFTINSGNVKNVAMDYTDWDW